MTGGRIHVLIVGADQPAVDRATLALAQAGHTVSHVTPESQTPFASPAGGDGEFRPDSVDVVLSIPGQALSSVPWCEVLVIDLVHRGVPLVLAGTPFASPFTAWASHCVDRGVDIVSICEAAVAERSQPEADDPRDVVRPRYGPVDFAQGGGEAITRHRCLALLRTATVGRVGLTSGSLPIVVPVDYRMWGEQVVFRTRVGSHLHRAACDAVLAFEVDALGPTHAWGWSVMVTGVAHDVTGTVAESAPPVATDRWWAASGDERLVAVPTDVVAGCRLHGRPNHHSVS